MYHTFFMRSSLIIDGRLGCFQVLAVVNGAVTNVRVHANFRFRVLSPYMPGMGLLGHMVLPSIFPNLRVFSNDSALHIRWLKYLSFSFNIYPSNEYSWLISSRIDWFDLAAQGILKSLLQHRLESILLYALGSLQNTHPWGR